MSPLSTEILLRLGKACTCRRKDVNPMNHDDGCPWRKAAEASLAEDAAFRREQEMDSD